MKRLHVRDRVIISHDSCTSGTSRVPKVASLQPLTVEALIPAASDCKVRSVIKFLNAQSIAPIEIRQVCQVYDHNRLDGQHICRNMSGWCLSPTLSPDLAPNDFPLFLHLKKFLYGHRQRFQNHKEAEMSVTVVPIPDGRLLRQRIQKLVPWYDKCLNSGGEYVEK